MFWIASPHRATFASLGLNSTAAIARYFFGEAPRDQRGVQIIKRTLPAGGESIPVFCKQYLFPTATWKFIGRASKARCEFANYEVFSNLEIPCAEPVVCGEERDWMGRLRRAYIVTREVPEAQTLVEFFRSGPVDRKVRAELVRQIAEMTRRIHHAGFFHHDLVWRNILVTRDPTPKLWWIDCPRGQFDHWSPWRNRRRLKDLASLDKLASQECTERERVRFITIYLGQERLGSSGKKLVRDALAYRKERWPEDWIDPAG